MYYYGHQKWICCVLLRTIHYSDLSISLIWHLYLCYKRHKSPPILQTIRKTKIVLLSCRMHSPNNNGLFRVPYPAYSKNRYPQKQYTACHFAQPCHKRGVGHYVIVQFQIHSPYQALQMTFIFTQSVIFVLTTDHRPHLMLFL